MPLPPPDTTMDQLAGECCANNATTQQMQALVSMVIPSHNPCLLANPTQLSWRLAGHSQLPKAGYHGRWRLAH
jgi:hypothetical protein